MTTNITPLEALEKIKNYIVEITDGGGTTGYDCSNAGAVAHIIDQALVPQECDVTNVLNDIINAKPIYKHKLFTIYDNGRIGKNVQELSNEDVIVIMVKQLHSQEKNYEQQLYEANAEIKSLTEIKDFESEMRVKAEQQNL